MAPIVWRDEFETGVGDADTEHAQLIDSINALIHKLGDKPPQPLIAEVLGEIRAKIAAHFAAEEKIMRERGYDDYADHKADHEILLDEIRAIASAVDEHGTFVHGDALVRRVSCWFAEHFKTRDKRLHRMLGG